MLAHTFRAAARANLVLKRSLASTVLLSRTWADETVAVLRKEASSRGLSSKGTKALLIQRLQENDTKSMKFAPTPSNTREASTAPPAEAERTPTRSIEAELLAFTNIQIPDASYPEPELQARVPYVPDFWDSPGRITNSPDQTEAFIPKVVVVAGATTHLGGGPSHHGTLEPIDPVDEQDPTDTEAVPAADLTPGGVFFDIAQDLGFVNQVPKPKPTIRTPFWQLFA